MKCDFHDFVPIMSKEEGAMLDICKVVRWCGTVKVATEVDGDHLN